MRRMLQVAIAGLMLLGLAAAPAQAGDDEIRREGPCSGRSDWEMRVRLDDGRFRVRWRVDSRIPGQTWKMKLSTTESGSPRPPGPRTATVRPRSTSGAFATTTAGTCSGDGPATRTRTRPAPAGSRSDPTDRATRPGPTARASRHLRVVGPGGHVRAHPLSVGHEMLDRHLEVERPGLHHDLAVHPPGERGVDLPSLHTVQPGL
jgi:hypothetical protein